MSSPCAPLKLCSLSAPRIFSIEVQHKLLEYGVPCQECVCRSFTRTTLPVPLASSVADMRSRREVAVASQASVVLNNATFSATSATFCTLVSSVLEGHHFPPTTQLAYLGYLLVRARARNGGSLGGWSGPPSQACGIVGVGRCFCVLVRRTRMIGSIVFSGQFFTFRLFASFCCTCGGVIGAFLTFQCVFCSSFVDRTLYERVGMP